MYEFLIGPGLWITLIVFLGGSIARVVFFLILSRAKDRVLYNHIGLRWGLRSIFHWIIPFASVSMRRQPVFTLAVFSFHISFFAVLFFLSAHDMLWDAVFGLSFWHIPDLLADIMTVILICSGLFLIVRRVARSEVRILSSAWDYILLIIVLLPFITGFMAFHQWGPYELVFTLHVLFGEILLVLIPFSKLSHGIFFFFTRAFMGFDMGSRRGARSW